MTFKNLLLAASLFVMPMSMQACTSEAAESPSAAIAQIADLSTLEKSADDARYFDYCHWAFEQDGKSANLPDYDVILDREIDPLPHEQRTAMILLDAGTRIAQNSKSKKACAKTFKKGTKAFDKQLKKSLGQHWKRATYEKSGDSEIAAIQDALATYWVEDQAARRVYLGSKTEDKTGAAHWTRRLAVVQAAGADERSTAYMKGLLEEYDWIDKNRFGDRVSMAAWLLVQHADDHVELQSLALARMEPYLKTNGVSKGDYAYLWDRVAVNTDKKQRYGTQPTWECNDAGQLTLQPLEDPENVNKRREDMGLGSVEDGLAEMTRSVCG